MADKISPGVHTFQEILDRAGVDFQKAVTVENEDGSTRVDHRRVLVGGLGFDDPNQIFNVPEEGDPIEVRVDGKSAGKVEIDGGADSRSALELPDHALVPHVDPEKPGVTVLTVKRDAVS